MVYGSRDWVLWVLSHIRELKQGIMPESNYEDCTPSSGNSGNAGFEHPCDIAGEVEIRLQRCGLTKVLYRGAEWGKDGLMTIQNYISPDTFTVDRLAEKNNLSRREVNNRINQAINYAASGPCVRWASCDTCLSRGGCQYKNKGRPAQNYEEWLIGDVVNLVMERV